MRFWCLPCILLCLPLIRWQLHVQRAIGEVENDDVARLEKPKSAADFRFGRGIENGLAFGSSRFPSITYRR